MCGIVCSFIFYHWSIKQDLLILKMGANRGLKKKKWRALYGRRGNTNLENGKADLLEKGNRTDGQNSFIIVWVVFSSLENIYSCPMFTHVFSKHHFQLVLIISYVKCWSLSCVQPFVTPWTARFLCPWNSPGKNTGVGIHSSIQGIFLIQASNMVSCTAGRLFTVQITREAPL